MNLDLSQYLKSNFIKGRDVPEGLFLTIADVHEEEFRDGSRKPCLTFNEDDRMVALGNQNLKTLIAAWGDQTDKWVGRVVLLIAGPEYQGNPSLLVKPQKQEAPRRPTAAQYAPPASADQPF